MRIPAAFLILLCLFFVGCKDTSEKEIEPEISVVEEQTQDSHEAETWKSDIALNNGTQWQANKATTDGILTMTAMIEKSSPTSFEEYRELGNRLNEEKDLLIKKCTMEGPSHNNLHIYLQPLISEIAGLREVNSAQDGKILIAKIREHLQEYHTYFV